MLTSPTAATRDDEYDDVRIDLSVHPDGAGQVRARVLSSPAGEGRTLFSRPLDEASLVTLLRTFDAARDRNYRPDPDAEIAAPLETPEQALRRLGEELYGNLFSGDLGKLWERVQGTGDRPARPLRLVLQMDLDDGDTARLHALPWECLRPPGVSLPLLLEPHVSLVRYVSRCGVPTMPPQPSRLRVLAVSAGVSDDDLARLDLERELRGLSEADVDLVVARDLPFERLGDALREHRPHVLHFLGHAAFRTRQGGVLYFPDGAGGSVALEPEALARCLRSCSCLRLVVLNACVTARADHRAPFAGVATGLIAMAGVPVVVGMQRPISDAAAGRFAAAVYRHLAAGATVDRAVSEGRRLAGSEWATPVVFSRLPGGRLFAAAQPPRSRWTGWAAALALAAVLGGAAAGFLPRWQRVPGSPAPTTQGSEVPATLQDLRDGDRVYLPQADAYLSATFRQLGELVFPTLDLAGSKAPRAVERPRTVDFVTDDGVVSVEVVSIDLDARSLSVRTVVPGSETAG